jgi:8-hydroxy-5-deazaflavin:NADPH oxidoreductase
VTQTRPTIAVLGGTGKEGGGLALRWADLGYPVVIGSRTAERAEEAAASLRETLGRMDVHISGADNATAARAGEIIVLAVPYAAQQSTAGDVADYLDGKILIDVTVPLMPPKVGQVQLPEGGSAVEALQKMLGAGVRVVSAFQNISAHHLAHRDAQADCDVLVCADDAAAAETVIAMAEEIGLKAWNAGPLCNSVVAEALTSVLITLNRRYKVPGSGIRITGI